MQSDPAAPATVLIVDDQALLRTGFRALIDAESDLQVVGEAADGRSALAEAARLTPDVVLMDIRMPEMDGLEATRRLSESGSASKVLILSTFDLDDYVFEALRAGASGFVLKSGELDALLNAIRTVADGDALLAPSITRRLIDRFATEPAVRSDPRTASEWIAALTPREREVLQLVARGLTNAEIAALMHISLPTAKTHVSRLLMKLAARDRVQLVILAYEAGLVARS